MDGGTDRRGNRNIIQIFLWSIVGPAIQVSGRLDYGVHSVVWCAVSSIKAHKLLRSALHWLALYHRTSILEKIKIFKARIGFIVLGSMVGPVIQVRGRMGFKDSSRLGKNRKLSFSKIQFSISACSMSTPKISTLLSTTTLQRSTMELQPYPGFSYYRLQYTTDCCNFDNPYLHMPLHLKCPHQAVVYLRVSAASPVQNKFLYILSDLAFM